MEKCNLTQVPCRKAIMDVVQANKDRRSLQHTYELAELFRIACSGNEAFATRYIEEGGNMQTLQKILGHSSLAMTADLYAHVLPNTKQQEMQQIENGFIGVAVL